MKNAVLPLKGANMPILNYTTQVPVNKTVSEVHTILAKAGANAILNEYDAQGNISGVKFRLVVRGSQVFYDLPANINGVTNVLKKDRQYRDEAHARRVAWRIIKDWIEAQMAIVIAGMAEVPQVFLPYAQTDNGQNVYERLQSQGFALLEGPKA
jgi:hypothetical protein